MPCKKCMNASMFQGWSSALGAKSWKTKKMVAKGTLLLGSHSAGLRSGRRWDGPQFPLSSQRTPLKNENDQRSSKGTLQQKFNLNIDIWFLHMTFEIWHSTNGPMDQWTNGPMDKWTNGPMDIWHSLVTLVTLIALTLGCFRKNTFSRKWKVQPTKH